MQTGLENARRENKRYDHQSTFSAIYLLTFCCAFLLYTLIKMEAVVAKMANYVSVKGK